MNLHSLSLLPVHITTVGLEEELPVLPLEMVLLFLLYRELEGASIHNLCLQM